MSSPPKSQLPKPSRPSMRRLVNFYDPAVKGADAYGRTLDEILGWSDAELEHQHDYIQTVFPLPEPSGLGHTAPVVDEETMLIFRASAALQANLVRALKRMLAFYGFDVEDRVRDPGGWGRGRRPGDFELDITPKDDRRAGFSRWAQPAGHNHLRITRIIRSLRVLGLQGVAVDFYGALAEVQAAWAAVSLTTREYWGWAMEVSLCLAPDGTEIRWLRNY
ncbi:putative opioid growth factor receptor region [Rosellinia necatrix]|uniref:Putative opioid growth factor receptor region n=1 Tax=Rosellinia necatrix TaxID=77044 RepID=A0A1W2TJX2_ROSNE|nr:putative opioid growth factor receptor region [Rosellinia necatrix]